MKKKYIFLIGESIILVGVLGLALLYIYGFSISRPNYDEEYFTQEYLEKYSSPEKAFDHFIDALMSEDAEYYQEVLGRKLTEVKQEYFEEHPYDGWKRPEIVNIEKRGYSLYCHR